MTIEYQLCLVSGIRKYQSSGKEKESSCLVHVLHKTLRRRRAVTAKKRTQKLDARAKLLFC